MDIFPAHLGLLLPASTAQLTLCVSQTARGRNTCLAVKVILLLLAPELKMLDFRR